MDGRIDQLKELHARSLDQIKSAVFAVQPYLSKKKFRKLYALWTEYKNEDKDKLDWGLSMAREAVHAMNPNAPNPHISADHLLQSYFKKFRELVE